MCQHMQPGDIIRLNVGGTKFATSRQTLTWVPDSFFASMLSGRISTLKDEDGSIFIDRDPKLFNFILNFLRTKDIDINNLEIRSLRHEAEFYGIAPLVNRLALCEDCNYSSCGNVLFQGYLMPPVTLFSIGSKKIWEKDSVSREKNSVCHSCEVNFPLSERSSFSNIHQGSVFRVATDYSPQRRMCQSTLDLQSSHSNLRCNSSEVRGHSRDHFRSSSLDLRHILKPSVDFLRSRKMDSNTVGTSSGSSKCIHTSYVHMIKGDHNWIAVSYAHFVCCYRFYNSCGWQLAFISPYIEPVIERIALHAKVLFYGTPENNTKLLAISHGSQVRLWAIKEDDTRTDIGMFPLNVPVDHLFFIKRQLVALSLTGKIGVWHSTTQHWQIQDVDPITSFDTAGSFLLLGCKNGSIYYIDMEKFPLRMKDNDLLVTELYHDPRNDIITAVGVYLTPQTSLRGNWIEMAYGTSSGTVCVIVQNPETVGNEPRLFQTYNVHRSPVTKVALSEKYLISVCSEYNHVRTWRVNRFRGMISTQPGSTPLASFKVISLENVEADSNSIFAHSDCGPYGQQDDEQVFIQKLVPETDQLYVRYASSGQRICVIKSVDGTAITTFCVHECEGSNRIGSRSKRCIVTGHISGAIQIWDLTTALDLAEEETSAAVPGGPSPEEIIRLLDHCDLTTAPSSIISNYSTVAPSLN